MPAKRRHLVFLGWHHWLGWATHQQAGTSNPQVGQGKQGVQLLGVLAQASVSDLSMAAVDLKELHAKIGQLTLEKDFLQSVLSKAGLLSVSQ